ncbi:MAG: hypothetical protein KME67_04940 [Candidatus Thiodiazotropha sp. (ex Codakia orbicularis)]|nr:hypothetical protein [Candidatus Thiodiazotropha sp. (ex Codakia orbicularis)]
MSHKQEFIARRQIINEIDDRHIKERYELREKHDNEISDLQLQERDFRDFLIGRYRLKVDKEHECTCCGPRYPDSYFIDDNGIFHVRYNANHPNDIRDEEIDIDELIAETN